MNAESEGARSIPGIEFLSRMYKGRKRQLEALLKGDANEAREAINDYYSAHRELLSLGLDEREIILDPAKGPIVDPTKGKVVDLVGKWSGVLTTVSAKVSKKHGEPKPGEAVNGEMMMDRRRYKYVFLRTVQDDGTAVVGSLFVHRPLMETHHFVLVAVPHRRSQFGLHVDNTTLCYSYKHESGRKDLASKTEIIVEEEKDQNLTLRVLNQEATLNNQNMMTLVTATVKDGQFLFLLTFENTEDFEGQKINVATTREFRPLKLKGGEIVYQGKPLYYSGTNQPVDRLDPGLKKRDKARYEKAKEMQNSLSGIMPKRFTLDQVSEMVANTLEGRAFTAGVVYADSPH